MHCSVHGNKVPFLPVIAIEEKKLFAMLCATHGMNASAIMSTWNNHIDGVTIFPKLEVCLRMCLDKWNKNKKIEACALASKNGIKNLRTSFQFTAPAMRSTANNYSSTCLNHTLSTNDILEANNKKCFKSKQCLLEC